MEEVWKQYGETNYDVSNLGRVRSNNYGGHGRKELLKLSETEKGYMRCFIYENGKAKQKKVHRMVAETFIGRIEGKEEVNHIDCDKKNNAVWNLEWCSRLENMRHAHSSGRMENMKEHAKTVSKPIIGTYLDGGRKVRFGSTEEASRVLGIRRSNIYNVLHGKYHKTHGMTFSYEVSGNGRI